MITPINHTLDNTTNEIDPYDLGFIINIIHNKKFKLHPDKQIEKIDIEMEKIVNNINSESVYIFDENEYSKQIRFLGNKIHINSKYDNNLAVSRDKLKIMILENKKNFAQTINAIIEGKDSFKDKKYFIFLLNTSIEELNKIDLKIYQKLGSTLSDLNDSLSITSIISLPATLSSTKTVKSRFTLGNGDIFL